MSSRPGSVLGYRATSCRATNLAMLLLLSAALAFPLISAKEPPGGRPRYKSPLALAVNQDGSRAYVALHMADAVAVVDLRGGKVLREIPVGKRPYDLALAQDRVFVTCEGDDKVVMLDLKRGVVDREFSVGQAPHGLVLNVEAGEAYVACHDQRAVDIVDWTTGRSSTIALSFRPERLGIQPNGLVAGAGEQHGQTFGTLITAQKVKYPVDLLLPGVTNLRGLVMDGGPKYVYQRPRSQVPATQVFQGWVFTNHFAGEALDEPQRSHADPSDVVVTHRHAYVASAGADVVLRVDLLTLSKEPPEADKRRAPIYPGAIYEGGGDLTASRRYVTGRLPVEANPRRLALSGDGKTLVVSNHLADSLAVIDTERFEVIRHISLGGPPPDAARRGEILFNSGKLTFHGQFTCASCHPNGDSDNLNWDLERDGVGNFKNTRSLLGVADTAPYGWHASSPTLEDRIQGTLRTLHRHEPAGTEVADLAAYLRSLPPPRRLRQDESAKPAIARGQALFQGKGQCGQCHRRGALDDDKPHDVGTRGPTDTQDRFDTPTLRGIVFTGPYLHDGRAATLEEVFTKHNAKHFHGAAHLLSAAELADLVAYLKCL